MDTMKMPKSRGYEYIAHGRCSISGYPEHRELRRETGKMLGSFTFEDFLCRWGPLTEIVTDNGTPWVAALDYLAARYGIRHIRISAYNSQANGIIERPHLDVREAIVKASGDDISKWADVVHHVFWAERVTVKKSTGLSPFQMAHGVEPLLPFDLAEATFLAPDMNKPHTSEQLILIRARQLMKRDEDLAKIRERVLKARFASIAQFEKRYANTIVDYDFKPGALVLVRNITAEKDLGGKVRPRYLGPMVVIRRTEGGSYRLAGLDGAVSRLRYAAFRLIPYHCRIPTSIPVTELLDPSAEEKMEGFEEDERAVEMEEEVLAEEDDADD